MTLPAFDLDAVVIGTSAGGVEALLQLAQALPAGFPAAVLVVLHRPDQPGAGASPAALMARLCALPVDDAWDREPVFPGTVRLAPAGYHLLVDDGPVLSLSVDAPVLWSRPAIDPLFESAARVWGARLLALVLTGASRDGSAGALAVRRAGGRVWIQDPATAAASTMPAAALETAGADKVGSLEDLFASLGQLALGRQP